MKNYKKFLALKKQPKKYNDGGSVKGYSNETEELLRQADKLIARDKADSDAYNKQLEKQLTEDEKYADGGQVQESQQKRFQAKDYFGKGSNGAGEGVANSMGGLRMFEGEEVPSFMDQALSSIRGAFGNPDKPLSEDEKRELRYKKIREQNSQNFSEGGDVSMDDDSSKSTIDKEKLKKMQQGMKSVFADGGPVRKSMEQRIKSPIQVIDPITGEVKQTVQKRYSAPSVSEETPQPSLNEPKQEESPQISEKTIDDMAKDKLKRYLNLVNKVQDKTSPQQKQPMMNQQEKLGPIVDDKMLYQIGEDIRSNPEKHQEVLRHYENHGVEITPELLDRINGHIDSMESAKPKLSTGGWTPEQLPKAQKIPGIKNIINKKQTMNIPRAPRLTIPKRLRPISDVKGYADGGDITEENNKDMNLGDMPIQVEGLPYDYHAEDQEAQKAIDFSNEEQIRKELEDQSDKKDVAPVVEESKNPNEVNLEGDILHKTDIPSEMMQDEESEKELTSKEPSKEEPVKEQAPQEKPFNALQAMKEAQDYRDKSQMWNQLGAIAERGAAGYARIPTTQQETYKENMQIAQQAVDDTKTKIAMQGYDPNSPMSKMFRKYLEKFSGQAVDPNTTAMDGKEILPIVFKDFEAKQAEATRKEIATERAQERLHQTEMIVEQRREAAKDRAEALKASQRDKKDKADAAKDEKREILDTNRVDKMNKMISEDIATSRSSFGVAARNRQSVDNINALISGTKDFNDLDNRQIVETARVLDRILSGGQATISGSEHLTPDSARQWVAKKLEFITSKRRGAGAGSFVKTMADTLDREGKQADKQIIAAQGKMLGPLKGIEKNDKSSRSYEAYINMLKSHHLDALLPKEEQENTKQEAISPEKTVVRKGYNAKTNQTQLIYSDGTSEIKDGKL